MDDKQKIYFPETVTDTPFPTEEQPVSLEVAENQSAEVSQNKTTKAQDFPTRRVAYEVLGNALNTRSKKILAEFDFGKSGALQIGEYQNGTSGDIRISPNGIVARDSAGVTTFALDGTTGSAVFKGTIQSDTLISGLVQVGGDKVVIDGENNQILVYDENDNVAILIGYLKDAF